MEEQKIDNSDKKKLDNQLAAQTAKLSGYISSKKGIHVED